MQSNVSYAETSQKIVFQDQSVENFNLENFLKDIKYVDEEVKDTCVKKVPYEENVCKDVTKYKKECGIVPAHQECKNVNNPICHTKTEMEEECYNLPSRQQCSTVSVPVCKYETKYDNVCSTTPSRQDCRPVTEQQCRVETRYTNECRTVPGENQCRVVVRYRNECSQVPGGQQCRTIPGDVQCSIVNGENRCVKIPPRQECSDAPSRQECRQVPYEERECSQGPSRQECRQVPKEERVCENHTRQECRTIPGEYQCQQVSRQEQVCRNENQQQCSTVPGDEVCRDVPREREVCVDNYKKVCENIPAKEVCKDVPYKETVCKMETKYKDEKYECTKVVKVPKETLLKTHRAQVAVEFKALSKILGLTFTFNLDTKGNISVVSNKANQEDSWGVNSNVAMAFVKKEVKADDRGEINDINAKFKILLLNKNEFMGYLNTPEMLAGELSKYSFSFKLRGKLDSKRTNLSMRIVKKEKVEIDKKISKGNIRYEYIAAENVTRVIVDLKSEGAKIGSIFTGENTSFRVTLSFSQDYSDAGDAQLTTVQNPVFEGWGDFTLTR